MAHHVEPMDVDKSICDFDNKENSLQHTNVLTMGPCTEKGYEELEVSELNMKLRYSITPTSSPMSKSFTANCLDNKQFEAVDNNITSAEKANLTHSMNSTISKNNSIKRVLPLQSLPTDQLTDSNRNALQPLDSTASLEKDVTISVSRPNDLDENLSIPSSSSSLANTPEATTPTKELKQDSGSPIMRGLKSVLSMFRPSQSPITTTDDNTIKPEALSPPVINSPNSSDSTPSTMLVSTPLAAQKTAVSKRETPNRDSIVFKDDLENELEWKDETIIFNTEKIPIHKLFMTQNKPVMSKTSSSILNEVKAIEAREKLDSNVEYMDISLNDSIFKDITVTPTKEAINKNDITNVTESDSEFLDCETTFSKDEDKNVSLDDNVKEVHSLGLNATVTNESLNDTLSKTHDSAAEIAKALTNIENDLTPLEEVKRDLVENEITYNNITTNTCKAVSGTQLESELHLANKSTGHVSPSYDIELDIGNHNYSPSNKIVNLVQNVDTIMPSVDKEKLSDNIVVSSLSQIPLIADPRVLLFNIPDKTSIPAQSTQYPENRNTSPADIPLPDDEDLEKFEVNKETDKQDPNYNNLDVMEQRPIADSLCMISGTVSSSNETPITYVVEEQLDGKHEQIEATELVQLQAGASENKMIVVDISTNNIESLPKLGQVKLNDNTVEQNVVNDVPSIHKAEVIPLNNVETLETTNEISSTFVNYENVDVNDDSVVSKDIKKLPLPTSEIEHSGDVLQNDTNDVTKTKSDLIEVKLENVDVKVDIVASKENKKMPLPTSEIEHNGDLLQIETNDTTKNDLTEVKPIEIMPQKERMILGEQIYSHTISLPELGQVKLNANTVHQNVVNDVPSIHKAEVIPLHNVETLETTNEISSVFVNYENVDVKDDHVASKDSKKLLLPTSEIEHNGDVLQNDTNDVTKPKSDLTEVKLENVDVKVDIVASKESKKMPLPTSEIEHNGDLLQIETNDATKSDLTAVKPVEIMPQKERMNLGEQIYSHNITLKDEQQTLVRDENVLTDISTNEAENLSYAASNEEITEADKNVYQYLTNSNLEEIVGNEIPNFDVEKILEKEVKHNDKEEIHEDKICLNVAQEIVQFVDNVADVVRDKCNEIRTSTASPISVLNSFEPEIITTMEAKIETHLEEEIVASKDNSPFAAITEADKNVYQYLTNSNLEEIVGNEIPNFDVEKILEKEVKHNDKEEIHEDKICLNVAQEIEQFVDNVADVVRDKCNEIRTSTASPISVLNSFEPEIITTMEAKIETHLEEEIVASKDNSPFDAITAEDLKENPKPQSQEYDDFENVDSQNTTKTEIEISPPLSPKIVSKGYNFNFDEIDDPFATKTKIKLSPPRDGSPKNSFEKNEINVTKPKTDLAKNRHNCQPARKKYANSKKVKSTFGDTSNISIDAQEAKAIYEASAISSKAVSTKDDISKEKSKYEKISKEEFNKDSEIVKDADKTVNEIQEPKVVNDCINTSSSELSDCQSAKASLCDIKNVFNLPEIDDANFNPFVTKLKVRQSPVPFQQIDDSLVTKNKIRLSPVPYDNSEKTVSENAGNEDCDEIKQQDDSSEKTVSENAGNEDCDEIKQQAKLTFESKCPVLEEQNLSNDASNTTCSSKTTDEKDITVHEVHTEDEDTIEGPFLEDADINYDDKISDFCGENLEMMQFSKLSPQQSRNQEPREIFIDAETFEFLLNQNKADEVADSGKESLFLKFDPLYAKRMSSDGLVAALNMVQKKQSTPKKIAEFQQNDIIFDKSPVAGPSTLNITLETDAPNITDESTEDLNITVTKPMMVVNPAVNPVPAPRNKTITPGRSNRQSLTFTSPAIAAIDRLLSMSANNSLLGHEVTVAEIREHNEADLALTQLRELLADKEISVYNLKSESKELKERLSTLEFQMKKLEVISEERLKKINDLSEKLAEKTRMNNSMASVVEEYERTIASLIAETEQDRKRHAEERLQLINERDEQTRHLASMEVSFSDLHSKYEKSKQVIFGFKANEDSLKKSIKDFEDNFVKMQTNYELLKQHATSKLNHANEELQKMNRAHETEVLKLNAMIKRQELHITSLEETLLQKTKANEELTAICDELINRVA